MRLTGKGALVTGAGRGTGKGCAVELARAGADIVLNNRPESPAEEIRALGRWCHMITGVVLPVGGLYRFGHGVAAMVPQRKDVN